MTTRTRFAAIALVADIFLVLVFSAIGRNSHAEGVTVGGVASTAWPFLVGLLVGWVVTVALYREKFIASAVIPTGVVAWLSTVAVGMVLRQVSGEGTAFSFIVVASVTLAVFLVGWRGVFLLVRRARR